MGGHLGSAWGHDQAARIGPTTSLACLQQARQEQLQRRAISSLLALQSCCCCCCCCWTEGKQQLSSWCAALVFWGLDGGLGHSLALAGLGWWLCCGWWRCLFGAVRLHPFAGSFVLLDCGAVRCTGLSAVPVQGCASHTGLCFLQFLFMLQIMWRSSSWADLLVCARGVVHVPNFAP